MKIAEYKNIFNNEDSHFFYVANRRIIISLIEKFKTGGKKVRILDAGCGTGLLAKKLAKYGEVLGTDISDEAVKFARLCNIKVQKASITKLPFPTNTFDIVTCIDVINHRWVKNDLRALKELNRVLKTTGLLIIRASANSWLHLSHDQHVFLKKRYDKSEFQNKLLNAGFIIKKISYINMILLPMAMIQSLIEKLKPSQTSTSAIKTIPRPLNSLMTFILSLEARLLPWINLPFGIALIAICQKPQPNFHIPKQPLPEK